MSTTDKRFAFWGGDIVRLLQDHPHLQLKAGDQGYVWGVYDLEPPMYEADFYSQDSSGCAMMFKEHEVERVSDPHDVRIPQDVIEFWRLAF